MKKVSGGWWERFTFIGDIARPPIGDTVAVLDRGMRHKSDPVTVMVRRLPEGWGLAEVVEYFGGNLSSDQASAFERVDGVAVEPMRPGRFWELIAVMGGSASAASFRRLGKALGELDEVEVIAFQKALDEVLRSLEIPALVVTSRFRGEHVRSDDATSSLRCEVIVAGEEAVRSALADPDAPARRSARGLRGEPLLLVAGEELARRRGVSGAWIDTGYVSPEALAWRQTVRPPYTWANWLAEFRSRAKQSVASLGEEIMRGWDDPYDQYYWTAVRYVVETDGVPTEYLELVPYPIVVGQPDEVMSSVTLNQDRLASAEAYIGRRVESLGGALQASETCGANAAPWNAGMFEIHRRSRLTATAYREKYLIDEKWIR
jgi:hypothetical protein